MGCRVSRETADKRSYWNTGWAPLQSMAGPSLSVARPPFSVAGPPSGKITAAALAAGAANHPSCSCSTSYS
eukprot:352701-Chlamydomonas_euryale.AAC.4